MPAGSVTIGSALSDINGYPNTVVGAGGGIFVSETIGYTQPGGSIGDGTYSVVYDEDQDGILEPYDFIQEPAFTVDTSGSSIPPLDLTMLKSKAQSEADKKADTLILTRNFF